MKLATYIYVFITTFTLFGCTKHDSEIDDTKTYTVEFKATGFSQDIKDFNIKMADVKKNTVSEGSSILIKYLYFVVFDAQGNVVQSIKQYFSNTNFGTAEIRLPIGNYRLAVMGTSDYPSDPGNEPDVFIENLEKFRVSFAKAPLIPGNGDYYEVAHTFCSELLSFEVNKNPFVKKEIILKRISSQLDIIIDTMIPENIRSVALIIPSLHTYNFFGQNINRELPYFESLYELAGTIGHKISTPIFYGANGTNSPTSLVMKFYDQNRKLVLTKTVENIKFEKNKITQIKGNILDTYNGVSAHIGISFDGKITYTF